MYRSAEPSGGNNWSWHKARALQCCAKNNPPNICFFEESVVTSAHSKNGMVGTWLCVYKHEMLVCCKDKVIYCQQESKQMPHYRRCTIIPTRFNVRRCSITNLGINFQVDQCNSLVIISNNDKSFPGISEGLCWIRCLGEIFRMKNNWCVRLTFC